MSNDETMTELTTKTTDAIEAQKGWWDSSQNPLPQEVLESPPNNIPAPISPLTYAFLPAANQRMFDYDNLPGNSATNSSSSHLASEFTSSMDNTVDGEDQIHFSNNDETKKSKTYNINDLEVVNCDSEIGYSSAEDEEEVEVEVFEPKSHLGWANFAKKIEKVETKSNISPVYNITSKKKYHVIKARRDEKPRIYKSSALENVEATRYQAEKSTSGKNNYVQKSESRSTSHEHVFPSLLKQEPTEENNDGIVDQSSMLCFSLEPHADLLPREIRRKSLENNEKEIEEDILDVNNPPNLPPQRPQNSRYETMRFRKEMANRRSSYRHDEQLFRKKMRLSSSPPPFLEKQTGESPEDFINDCRNMSDPEDEDDEVDVVAIEETNTKSIENLFDHNPNEMLKTKIPSSSIPILPLSKSIMERKKAAVEMSRNTIRKIPTLKKNKTLNMSVAPKDVQVPAYSDRSPITLYVNKGPSINPKYKDLPVAVYRNPFSNIDMSNFKFSDDSSTIAVRAHLCDQTRVMIARIALWNREYAKKLRDNSSGTCWQKPDEVTAQMTGFCSATVRRCIEIANLAVVPKCADRVGVSKNDLTTLKKTFSEDPNFYGQKMRDPHILSQYYNMKSATSMRTPIKTREPITVQPKRIIVNHELKVKVKNEEPSVVRKTTEDKKQLPLFNRPLPSSQPPPLMVSKRPILQWNSIQASRAAQVTPPPNSQERSRQVLNSKSNVPSPSSSSSPPVTRRVSKESLIIPKRGRGRPKKQRMDEEDKKESQKVVRKTRKSCQEFEVIKSIVEKLVDNVTTIEPL